MIKITIDRLKNEDEEVMYINHHKIIKVKHSPKQTVLVLDNDESINIKETPHEIIKRIKEYEALSYTKKKIDERNKGIRI